MAKDRDSGDYGTAGLRYAITGSGSGLFSMDPGTGTISVGPCPTPGSGTCLDYEQTRNNILTLDYGVIRLINDDICLSSSSEPRLLKETWLVVNPIFPGKTPLGRIIIISSIFTLAT